MGGEQVENLGRAKSKSEKEKSQLQMEFNDVSAQYEDVSKAKSRAESTVKHLEEQVANLKLTAEESARAVSDLTSAKQKLAAEHAANSSALEDAEAKLSQVSRSKANMAQMVETLKQQFEEESKGKASMHHALQSARHDYDLLNEQFEEEQEAKNMVQRALSKANGEIANWRTKYESDAIQRTEELEDAKKKLASRLQAAEEQTENALAKASSVEKNKPNNNLPFKTRRLAASTNRWLNTNLSSMKLLLILLLLNVMSETTNLTSTSLNLPTKKALNTSKFARERTRTCPMKSVILMTNLPTELNLSMKSWRLR